MAIEIPSIVSRIYQNTANPFQEGVGKPRKLDFGDDEHIDIRKDGTGSVGGGKTFADTIKDAINSVDQTQKTADAKVGDVVAGRSDDIHEVMIAMEKAQLSFQMMLEVRNKAIETYQELSRIQI